MEIKNSKTWEEAKQIWDRNTKEFIGDYFCIYIKSSDKNEENALIDIIKEEDEDYLGATNNQVILAAGDKCVRVKEGDYVALNANMASSASLIFLEGLVFQVVPERTALSILNK